MSDTQMKTNWHQKLSDKINMLSEQFGLDEVQTDTFRGFITKLSKDQYQAGSRSGAGWAFAQARKGQTQ